MFYCFSELCLDFFIVFQNLACMHWLPDLSWQEPKTEVSVCYKGSPHHHYYHLFAIPPHHHHHHPFATKGAPHHHHYLFVSPPHHHHHHHPFAINGFRSASPSLSVCSSSSSSLPSSSLHLRLSLFSWKENIMYKVDAVLSKKYFY